jgi:hypothetical protein
MRNIILGLVFLSSMGGFQAVYAACYSDFDCGVGQKCVKAKGDINISGTCVTPSDSFGNPRIDSSPPRSQPRNVPGCSFNTDCEIGFSCVKRSGQLYGICVK